MMDKRGQLGLIETKYFFSGFLIGLIGGFVLVLLGTKKVIPFEIPLVCGTVWFAPFNRKGQLGWIEMKYFFIGLVIGLLIAFILAALGTSGVLPFKIPLVCG